MKIKLFFLLFLIFSLSQINSFAHDNEAKTSSNISQKYGFTIEEEKEIGLQSALLMIKKFSLYDNPQVVSYVRQVGDKIAKKVSNRPEIEYKFFVLNSTQVNAFAVPGGYIFVTKGLLSTLENEAQLAGVLSHEISHVELGHGLYSINKNPELREKLRIVKNNLEAGNALIQQSAKSFVTKDKDYTSGIVNSGGLNIRLEKTIKKQNDKIDIITY